MIGPLRRPAQLATAFCALIAPVWAQSEDQSNDGASFEWTFDSWIFGEVTIDVPEIGQTAVVIGGTATVNGEIDVGRLVFSNGTLVSKTGVSTDSLTLEGTGTNSRWTGGTISNLTLIINGSTAGLDLADSGGNNLSGSVIDNRATVDWTDGNIIAQSGSTISNSGTWNASFTGDHYLDTTSGTGLIFNNTGTFNMTGSGTLNSYEDFNNYGTVNVDDGVFVLNGGGSQTDGEDTGSFDVDDGATLRFNQNYTISDATKLLGDGVFELTGGTLTLNGEVNADNFLIKSGTLNGTHTFNNDATWTEGTIRDGSTTNAEESTFVIGSTGSNDLASHAFTNDGTVNWTDGTIIAQSGTTISNTGTWNATFADSHYLDTTSGVGLVFTNTGTFNYSGGGTLTFYEDFNNYGTLNVDDGTFVIQGSGSQDDGEESVGTFDVDAGSTLRFYSDYTISEANKLLGDGVFELFSGTLTLNGQVNADNFLIKGGTLKGTHTFNNDATWTEGTIRDGSTTNAEESTFAISSAGSNDLASHAFTNDGTVNWTDGTIIAQSGTTISNTGTWNATFADSHYLDTTSGVGLVFTNTGTFNYSGGGTLTFYEDFNNYGTLNVDDGTFVIQGGGSQDDGEESVGTFDVDAGSTLRFYSDYTISEANKLLGDGVFELFSGTLTLNGQVNADNFLIKGGTLKGTHTFNNDATWTEGTIRDGSTTNAEESTFVIGSAGTNDFFSHSFTNDGTVNWTDGNILAQTGTTISNQGTWNATFTDDQYLDTTSGTNLVFTNDGTFNKSNTGTLTFYENFKNFGTVNIDAGTFVLQGGGTQDDGEETVGTFDVDSEATLRFSSSYTISDAAKLLGEGVYEFTSGTLSLNGQVNAHNFLIKGGTLNGTHTFNNDATWTEGSIRNGSTTNAEESTFVIGSSGTNDFFSQAFINEGTVNWTDGNILAQTGTTISNQGTWNASFSDNHYLDTTSGTLLVFTNQGTFNKSNSGILTSYENFRNFGTVNVDGGTFVLQGGGSQHDGDDSGTFDVDDGATLRISNSYTISDASKLVGDGVYEFTSGTLSLTGNVAAQDFLIKGGTINGTHSFTNGATWSEGTFQGGSTTNADESTFVINAPSTNNFTSHSFTNDGTVNWNDGSILANTSSTIRNNGTFNATDDNQTYLYSTSGTTVLFTNTGTFNKTGSGELNVDGGFNNYGDLNVNQGTLILDGGGSQSDGEELEGSFDVATGATLRIDNSYTITDASRLDGDGTYEFTAGTLSLTGDVSASDFRIKGGSITGTHTFADDATWSEGTFLNGSTTNAADSTFVIDAPFTNNFTSHAFINEGTVNWNDGDILANTGSTIRNNGTFNATDDATHYIYSNSGTHLVFTNSGTFNKTGSGVLNVDEEFNNYGAVNVQSGTFILDGGGAQDDGEELTGSFDVDEEAILRFDNSYTITDAAKITGDGEVELTAGDLTISGVLSVDTTQDGGDVDGIFEIAGDFQWDDGSWDSEISGATTTIQSTGVLTMDDSTHYYRGRDIINNGTVNWTHGTMLTDSEGSFTNNGTFNDQSDGGENISESSGNAVFQNNGTFLKTSAGTTRIDMTFNNTSPKTLDVRNGTLQLNGGGTNSAGASMNVQDNGLIEFTDNYTVADASDLTASNLEAEGYELSGGTLTMNGNLGVDFLQSGGNLDGNTTINGDYTQSGGEIEGSKTINGTFTLTGGDWDADEDGATTTISSTGVVNIDPEGSQNPDYDNRDIINHGTFNWEHGDLDTTATGSFTNHGDFNDKTDHDHEIGETSGSATFTNLASGTFTKSGDSDTRVYQDFDNAGTLNIEDGRLVLKDEATFAATSEILISSGANLEIESDTSIASGAEISGGGTFVIDNGTLTGEADFDSDFTQDGGVLDGDFNFNSHWEFESGTIAAGRNIDLMSDASGVINATSILDLNNSELFVDEDAELDWESGTIRLGGGAEVTVEGLMTTNFDGTINQSLTGDGSVDVSGTFRKTAGEETTSFDLPVDVSGRFEVQAGSVQLSTGGTADGATFDIFEDANLRITNGYTFNDDTSVTNGGGLALTGGTFAINDSVDLGQQAKVSGGTITGTHTLSGKIDVNGGVFDSEGTTTIAEGATLRFSHVEDNPLDRSFDNDGTLQWAGGDMTGSGDNTLTNDGKFEVSVDGTFGAVEDDFTITNNGDFVKTGGTGTTIIDVPFTNNGLVAAESGQFRFTDSITFGDDATLGGGLQFEVPLSLSSSSTLAGNGTITGDITTGGKIAPGNSIGSLTITGDLTLLSTSNSFFEVSASTDPVSSDYVSVSGTLTLAGNLSWDLLASLDPVSTDTFTLYSANTLAGSFLNVANGSRLFTSDRQRSFVVNYGTSSVFDPNSVIFSNFEFTPIPEPSTWLLLSLGMSLIGFRRRRRS